MATRQPNTVLADLLAGVGWSPYDLARAINGTLETRLRIHATTPFTWRDKGVVPRGALPSLVAGLLSEAHGRVLTEHEIWPQLPDRPRIHETAIDGLHGPWTSAESLALLGALPTSGTGSVRRFFALSGAELIHAAANWHDSIPELLSERTTGVGVVTEEVVRYLENNAGALRRLDDGHGGALVQQAGSYQLSLTTNLLRDSRYRAQDGRALASVVAQLAQLTGWLHFDLDEHGYAQRHYLLALRAAGLAGDRQLAAMILSALATMQTWRGRPADAVALLDIATTGAPAGPGSRVTAILRIREARARAVGGDESGAMTAMRRAEAELDRADGEAPSWAYWLTPAVLSGEIGRSLLELGKTGQAARHLEQGVGLLGDTPSRDRVLYGLSLAKSYAATPDNSTGDLERACHELIQVLPAMRLVSSQRCRALLSEVVQDLSRHRTGYVRQAREQARELLQARI